MRKKRAVLGTGSLLLLLVAGLASSHDIWLLPDRFVLANGDTLVVRQLAGTELETEHDLALLRTMTPRFELITPNGVVDLLGELPDIRLRSEIRPVLTHVVEFEGLALVVMDHAFIWTEFTPGDFLEYLEHEEFDIAQFRPHMGRAEVETERYARALKTLVQVGSVSEGELHRFVVGQKLEILLLQNPYLLDPEEALEVRVLFDGRPLSDKLVMAFNKSADAVVMKSRSWTNGEGIARFHLTSEGTWLIRLVHMLPCGEHPDIDCDDVAWESYWSSFSFELR